MIFHLVVESEWRVRAVGGQYLPARYQLDGFVHCTADAATTLEVAQAYFADATEPVLAVEIDESRLESPVRWEAPAPPSTSPGAKPHHRPGRQFPHVYGAIALRAVTRVVPLVHEGTRFSWPRE